MPQLGKESCHLFGNVLNRPRWEKEESHGWDCALMPWVGKTEGVIWVGVCSHALGGQSKSHMDGTVFKCPEWAKRGVAWMRVRLKGEEVRGTRATQVLERLLTNWCGAIFGSTTILRIVWVRTNGLGALCSGGRGMAHVAIVRVQFRHGCMKCTRCTAS